MLLQTIRHIVNSWKGEGQREYPYDRRFAKAVELIWGVGSYIASATFQESCKDHIWGYT